METKNNKNNEKNTKETKTTKKENMTESKKKTTKKEEVEFMETEEVTLEDINKEKAEASESNLPANYEPTKMIDLVEKYKPIFDRGTVVADKIIDNAKGKDLTGATEIISEFEELAKGQETSDKGGNWFTNILKGGKKAIHKKLLENSRILEMLADREKDFEEAKNDLKDTVDFLYEMVDEYMEVQNQYKKAIEELEGELDAATKAFEAETEAGNTRKAHLLSTHIQGLKTLIQNYRGFLTTYGVEEMEARVQISTREMTYQTMDAFGAQITNAIKNQFANMQNKIPLENAQRQIKAGTEMMKKLMIENAKGTRDLAKIAAEQAYNPILDKETIDQLAVELRGIISDHATIVKQSSQQCLESFNSIKALKQGVVDEKKKSVKELISAVDLGKSLMSGEGVDERLCLESGVHENEEKDSEKSEENDSSTEDSTKK